MIRYALICERSHHFESWFPNSDSFDGQVRRRLVACPQCGSTKVEKQLMAPGVLAAKTSASKSSATESNADESRTESQAPPSPAPANAVDPAPVALISEEERVFRRKLREFREHLVSNSEFVGRRFAEEARRIHHGESERRSIHGEASPDDAKALLEEGIEFHPLPAIPEERN